MVAGGGTGLGAAPRAGDVPQLLLKVCRAGGAKFQRCRGMSELPGGLEVSHGTFTMELRGAWLGLGCSSAEGTSLKDPLGVV